jgi:hypothetical protein
MYLFFMYIDVSIYTHIYVYTCIYMDIHVYTYICMYVRTLTCVISHSKGESERGREGVHKRAEFVIVEVKIQYFYF